VYLHTRLRKCCGMTTPNRVFSRSRVSVTRGRCNAHHGHGAGLLQGRQRQPYHAMTSTSQSSHTVWHHATVTRQRREQQNGHRGVILWFTGLSGSGKSTLAHAVEERLHQQGCRTFVCDGDNVRHGLCGDLGFSREDRAENIRRIGQMARLFVESGMIVLTAFISPFAVDRQRVRMMVERSDDFIEVFCDCPLGICEQRDVKGLYQRARKGDVSDFTGISSPYEPPPHADLIVKTGERTVEQCVQEVLGLLYARGVVPVKHENV